MAWLLVDQIDAEVNVADYDGLTLLVPVCKMSKHLVGICGAEVNPKDCEARTPLIWC